MSRVLAKMYENESHAPYKCKISQFPANIPIFCSVFPANSLVKILRYFASRIASKIGLCLLHKHNNRKADRIAFLNHLTDHLSTGFACKLSDHVKGEVKAKIKISPVVVFGVLSRMVLVRES